MVVTRITGVPHGVEDGENARAATHPGPMPKSAMRHALLPAAIVTVALAFVTLPAAINQSVLSAATVVALAIAGGLCLLHPVGAGVLAGLALTLPLIHEPPFVGIAIFVSPASVAACTASSRLRAGLVIGVWHMAVLSLSTVLSGASPAQTISELLVWAVLLGLAAGAGLWVRHLVDRVAAERARRLSDLAEQRHMLARELHDTAVRATTEVVLFAETAAQRQDVEPDSLREFQRISRTARSATSELRALMDSLHSAEQLDVCLADLPLAAATWPDLLDRARGQLNALGFTVRVNVEAEDPLPKDVLRTMSRCLDEIRANVVRHGDPAVPVTLMSELSDDTGPRRLELVVLNGIRADEDVTLSGGAGLDGIRERLQPLGGTLVTRHEAAGFLTQISIPC